MKMNLSWSVLLICMSIGYAPIFPYHQDTAIQKTNSISKDTPSRQDEEEPDFYAMLDEIDLELNKMPEVGWWERCNYAYQLVADKTAQLGVEVTAFWYWLLKHLDDNKIIYSTIASAGAVITGIITYYVMAPEKKPVKPIPQKGQTSGTCTQESGGTGGTSDEPQPQMEQSKAGG